MKRIYTRGTEFGFGDDTGKFKALMGKFTGLIRKFAALVAGTTHLRYGRVRGNDGRNCLGACTQRVWRVRLVVTLLSPLRHSATETPENKNDATDVVLYRQRVKRDQFPGRAETSAKARQ